MVRSFLQSKAQDIAAQLADALGKFAKGEDDAALQDARAKRVEEILRALDFTGWDDLPDDVTSILMATAQDGAREALIQIGVQPTDEMLDLLNERAAEYAKARGAELVGKKEVDGELVDNPDAKWVITDSTRDMLRTDVTQAIEEGWSNDKLASAIADNYAFSDQRAEVIARTETAFADVNGNLEGYKASGVVASKEWIVGDGCCDECEEHDGEVVGLDEPFPNGGGIGPPLHPQCRCDVLPVLTDDEQQEQDDE